MRGLLSERAGLWFVVIAAVLWGTIGAATQAIYTLESVHSLSINLMRTLMATPLLLIACWLTLGSRMLAIERRDLVVMVLSGAILALSHASYFAAIRAAGITIATLITICAAPVLISATTVAFGMERLTTRTLAAIALALIGGVLLVGLNEPDATRSEMGAGIAWSCLAAVAYSGMILCNRSLAKRCHPLQTTSIMFVSGSVVLLVIVVMTRIPVSGSPLVWGLGAYLALFPTALAYTLFNIGLRRIPATTASVVCMLDPMIATVLAWLLYNEGLSLPALGGAGLLLISIGILAR